jgi:hypothetical protein
MPSRTKNLHPPGHPATATMLCEAIKHFVVENENSWTHTRLVTTCAIMSPSAYVEVHMLRSARMQAMASGCGVVRSEWQALRVLDLPPDGPICLTNLAGSCSSQCRTGATRYWLNRSSSLYSQYLQFGFVFWRHGMHVLTRTREPSVNMGRRAEKTTTKDKQTSKIGK